MPGSMLSTARAPTMGSNLAASASEPGTGRSLGFVGSPVYGNDMVDKGPLKSDGAVPVGAFNDSPQGRVALAQARDRMNGVAVQPPVSATQPILTAKEQLAAQGHDPNGIYRYDRDGNKVFLAEQRRAYAHTGMFDNGNLWNYADGGKVDPVEELLRRTSQKYGVSNSAPTPTPTPTPTPAPQPRPLGDVIQQRNETLRKINNYADGGKVEQYEFHGPGGPREDRIPVKFAGANIRVSNGERGMILPAKTASNPEAVDAIEDIIQSTNDGREPRRGLGNGGRYAQGAEPIAPEITVPPDAPQRGLLGRALDTTWDATRAGVGKVFNMSPNPEVQVATPPVEPPAAPSKPTTFEPPEWIKRSNEAMKWVKTGGGTPESFSAGYKPTGYGTQTTFSAASKVPAVIRVAGPVATALDVANRVKLVGDVAKQGGSGADVATAAAEQGSRFAGGMAGAGLGAGAALTYGAPLIAATGPFAPATAAVLGLGGGAAGYFGGEHLVRGLTAAGRAALGKGWHYANGGVTPRFENGTTDVTRAILPDHPDALKELRVRTGQGEPSSLPPLAVDPAEVEALRKARGTSAAPVAPVLPSPELSPRAFGPDPERFSVPYVQPVVSSGMPYGFDHIVMDGGAPEFIKQGNAGDAKQTPVSNTLRFTDRSFDPTQQTFAPGTGAATVTGGAKNDGRMMPGVKRNALGTTIVVGPGEYTAKDGTPTSDWTKTAAYEDAIRRNAQDQINLAQTQNERAGRDPMVSRGLGQAMLPPGSDAANDMSSLEAGQRTVAQNLMSPNPGTRALAARQQALLDNMWSKQMAVNKMNRDYAIKDTELATEGNASVIAQNKALEERLMRDPDFQTKEGDKTVPDPVKVGEYLNLLASTVRRAHDEAPPEQKHLWYNGSTKKARSPGELDAAQLSELRKLYDIKRRVDSQAGAWFWNGPNVTGDDLRDYALVPHGEDFEAPRLTKKTGKTFIVPREYLSDAAGARNKFMPALGRQQTTAYLPTGGVQ
ncbi:MAG TPA: hypothetical protein PL000_11920 [Anaerolineales bacterium]|nr:hypothetical protein [Anaerolineales bacterium]